MGGKSRPTGIRSPDRPARRQSLYRLSYPTSRFITVGLIMRIHTETQQLITGKGKVHPRTGHESTEGEYRYRFTLSLTSALDGVGGQCHNPGALHPGKRPGTHRIGGWVGSRAGLDGCRETCPPPPGIDPWAVQPITSHYTDCNIPAPINHWYRFFSRHDF